jgi:hypothetical protein
LTRPRWRRERGHQPAGAADRPAAIARECGGVVFRGCPGPGMGTRRGSRAGTSGTGLWPSFPPGRSPASRPRGHNHNQECTSLTSATENASAPRRVAFAGRRGAPGRRKACPHTSRLLNSACVSCGTRPGRLRWALHVITRESAYQKKSRSPTRKCQGFCSTCHNSTMFSPGSPAGHAFPGGLCPPSTPYQPSRLDLGQWQTPPVFTTDRAVRFSQTSVTVTSDHVSHSGKHPARTRETTPRNIPGTC